MNVQTTEYAGHQIRFIEGPENQLLLNTEDVCSVIGGIERAEGTHLHDTGIDLVSAVTLALHQDEDFGMWLNERFAQYDPETLVRPRLSAEDWNLQ